MQSQAIEKTTKNRKGERRRENGRKGGVYRNGVERNEIFAKLSNWCMVMSGLFVP